MKDLFIYLEAVEFSSVCDVGEVVHVIKVPVVCLSGGQHGHPAELMSHSLLQIGNHAGACNKARITVIYYSRSTHRQTTCCFSLTLKALRLCVLIPCELVKMTSLAFRLLGVGLLNDKRWKLTVWSHTAPGKPALHSSLCLQ